MIDPKILTPRQREILILIAKGHSDTEIARQLWISLTTVKTHRHTLFTRLDLHSRVAAVIYAYETGLVKPKAAPGPVVHIEQRPPERIIVPVAMEGPMRA